MRSLRSEGQEETALCDAVLRKLGVPNSKLGFEGLPDRIFWIPHGRPVLIEFKKPGEELERTQPLVHKRLLRLGYIVEIHVDAKEAFASIEAHMKEAARAKINPC